MDIKAMAAADKLTDEQKRELMRAVAEDEEIRKLYIKTRAFVLEPLIAKESQIRRIFNVENLAPGAQPYYPIGSKEVQVAWIAPGVGNAPRRQTSGDEVWAPTFNIQARVEWLMDLATDARFPIADEMNHYMVEQLKELENACGWNLIKACAADTSFPDNNTVQIGSTSGVDLTSGKGFFSKQLFSEMQYAADIQRRRITDIYASPKTLFDIFNYWGVQYSGGGNATTYVPNVPAGAAEEIYRRGTPGSGDSDSEFVMNMWGVNFHKVYNSDIVGDEAVYGFDLSGRRSRFGVMPIRSSLQTYEDPTAVLEYKVGFFGRERLGFAILDPVNLFVGIIDR